MSKRVDPDLGIVLEFLRHGQDWSQARLAEATGITPSLINNYEKGRKPLRRDRLEHLISCMGFEPEAIDGTLERLAANRASVSSVGGSGEGFLPTQRRIEAVVAKAGRLTTEFVRALMSLLTFEAEAHQAREEAKRLWARLERRKADERIALVEESPKFRSPALCELVSARSIEAAPNNPAEALELARLALRIAELCTGDDLLQQRTEGYAWFHVGNARRVTNDLRGSGVALEMAKRLWKAGASGDPGFFNETWVHWIEATIRKSQCRFPEALQQIEKALAADKGDLRGKLLLTKAQILGALGDIETSTEVLREAVLHIDEEGEPRTALGVRCRFLVNLCLQGRAVEAAPRLREVQALAEQLGQEVDLVHVDFIRGKIAAGTGQAEEAEEIFEQVRRKFASFKPPLTFDYALVSLDLGLLLLEHGRTSETRTLAEQMAWIFTRQGVHREALAALRIFCEAAKQETATVELTRSVIRFLHRSQHDPELKFENVEEAEVP
jgi:tetratricopeptide (TPR) repeat protein